MDEPKGTHRTRSRAAPDWTAEESLVLVNEINAVESDWGATLPSFQKWKQIVENCNALEVNRNLNQCRRKWDSLLSEYRRVRHEPDESFPVDLFQAIDSFVNAKGKGISGGEVDTVAGAEQLVMESDPDFDPMAWGFVAELHLETGSKRQRPRMKRKKRKLQTLRPWGYFTSSKAEHEESSSMNEKVMNSVKSLPEEEINKETKEKARGYFTSSKTKHEESSSMNEKGMNNAKGLPGEESKEETREQIMATMLYENAVRINVILESTPTIDVDYKLMDLKDAEALQTDFTRCQGDELIDCLEKILVTLNQLCYLVQ